MHQYDADKAQKITGCTSNDAIEAQKITGDALDFCPFLHGVVHGARKRQICNYTLCSIQSFLDM